MVSPVIPSDRLLTESEAAAILGWSKKTLQQRRWRGDLPPYIRLSGRCIRYVERELFEFISSCASNSSNNEVDRETAK